MSDKEYTYLAKIYGKRYGRFLPENKEAHIIDVACGGGHFIYFLQKAGYKNTIGIDLSEEQIEQAQKMDIGNVETADLFEHLANYSDYFQLVVANDIIEHFTKEEIIQFLDMIYRSLKPGGNVIISTLNGSSLFGASLYHSDFTHETGFTPTSLRQVLSTCHFKDIEIFGEEPVIYDFKSTARFFVWRCVKMILKLYMTIEHGTGRGIWKTHHIFEPRMFAVASKAPKDT